MSGENILREVDEALRVEKAVRFWKDHGKTLIVIAVALVLGTAVQSGWSTYKASQDKAATSQYLDALREKDPLSALGKLNETQNGSGSALAGLTAAAMLAEKNDPAAAIQAYEKVIGNKKSPKTYQELAALQIAALKLDTDSKATAADLLKLVDPVAADKTSAWTARALLLSAMIKADKGGDFAAARADLAKLLADKNLPASFSDQVHALDEVYRTKSETKTAQ